MSPDGFRACDRGAALRFGRALDDWVKAEREILGAQKPKVKAVRGIEAAGESTAIFWIDCDREPCVRLRSGMALEQRANVHLNAERERVQHVVHAAAVSRTQIKGARHVVVESEVNAVVSRQAYAPFFRA